MDDDAFTGTWTGSGEGVTIVLRLEQTGGGVGVRGTATAGSDHYTLEAVVDDGVAHGALAHAASGAVLLLALRPTPDGLQVELARLDPGSGAVNGQRFDVQRDDATDTGGSQGGTAATSEIDPRLVGVWSRRDTYTSNSPVGGDFSGTIVDVVELRADGSVVQGDGRVMVSGSSALGSYGLDTGSDPAAVAATGRWAVSQDVLLLSEHPQVPPQPAARYHVEGGSLMLTFGDGSRQVWHRR